VIACLQHYRERRRFFDAINEMLDQHITPAVDEGQTSLDQEVKKWQQRRRQGGSQQLHRHTDNSAIGQ
jgi:hypothetical protein